MSPVRERGVEYVDRGQAGKGDGGKDGQGKGNREGRGMWTGGRGVDGWTGGGVGGEYLGLSRQGAKCLSRKF